MKGIRTFTVIALVALTVVGWATFIFGNGSKYLENKSYISIADQWVEEGLYQRAILKYKEALVYDSTEKNWTKMMNAYEMRYAEDVSILSDYITELNNALALYPKNVSFVQKLYELHMVSNDYRSAYACMATAIENGVTDEKILKQAQELKYSYDLDYNTYSGFKSISANTYAVAKGTGWGCVDASGELIIDYNYPYMSSVSSDGTRLYDTSLGSRLVDSTGLVLGIFSFTVSESGVFSEDLIPVLCDGKYNYYNSFAKEQFGGYDMAGTFQNGLAAVQQDGKWVLINTSGKEESQEFVDIVIDSNGLYLMGSVMVAAKEDGKYQLFDKNGKSICDFIADNMDFCMSDGWIAYEKDGKWGYVNTEGKVVIEPQYEEAKSFSYGLAAVCKDGKWGFINTSGEVVIEYQFAGADYFNAGGSCMVRCDAPGVEDEELWKLLILNLGL
ncbi:MAG: WG repeat-containing protein [Tyzzerella sp.]|nr:WG repeat-containing protein [Tyzzerella sp.]